MDSLQHSSSGSSPFQPLCFWLMRDGHALLPSSLAPGCSQAESRPAEPGPDASVTVSCWQQQLEPFLGTASLSWVWF